jgi:hypothetical protein
MEEKTTPAKAIVSAVALVATAVTAAFADNMFNVSDASALAGALFVAASGVYAVYQTRNKPVRRVR